MHLTEQVQVHGKKITRSALYVLIGGFIIAMMQLFFVPHGYIHAPITFALFCLVAYNLNCVVVGSCTTWATILFVICAIFFVLAILMFFTDKKKWVAMMKK